ncbi:MAG: LLM class flavin-dependent oxidoreductase, partial [Rhodospirillales bacterium]|nr:LLM class flavin-dependent oxidoreductase [Rhodospirillales bacterium]
FSTKDMDDPLTDDEIASFTGILALYDGVVRDTGKKNPTTRDFITNSYRGTPTGAIVGDAKKIADHLEEFFVERAADGFVIGAAHVPGGYADFVKYVVPELQRRGLFQKEYKGNTLRENLGLARPASGDWKR